MLTDVLWVNKCLKRTDFLLESCLNFCQAMNEINKLICQKKEIMMILGI